MKRKKPVGIFVFGILNLIFGTLRCAWYSCCFLGGTIMVVAFRNAAREDRQKLDPLMEHFAADVPFLSSVLIGVVAVGLALGLMQIISGVGLVRVTNWGRWLSAVWGTCDFFYLIALLLWLAVVFYPALHNRIPELNQFMQDLNQRNARPGAPPQPQIGIGDAGSNPILDNAVQLLATGFFALYGAVVAIFMMLPQTGNAIARYRVSEPFEGELPPGLPLPPNDPMNQ